ncbi:hypothetical protein [Pseudonocardia endophytica]|uniref:Uncharacterized protein n=1 Tax=Pseudonocardia endophytica TaxID=401976 RepID=A0A4R1HGI0_PSEEN|nr:hypothetical protein [Pseudonocardia endophytica]TCK21257.1 hypothetical protein EV378_5237 [Pseudonocardia endophytica]
MTDGADDRGPEPSFDPASDMAPGGPRAKSRGCRCSVLANAAFRSGQSDEPAVDPRCEMHARH